MIENRVQIRLKLRLVFYKKNLTQKFGEEIFLEKSLGALLEFICPERTAHIFQNIVVCSRLEYYTCIKKFQHHVFPNACARRNWRM